MPFDDDFFNDPFENLIRDFFRGSSLEQRRRSQRFIKGEEEDRVIDFVEDGKKLYLVFELPGFDEKDVSVMIKGKEIKIVAKKAKTEDLRDYLSEKLRRGISIQKQLPNFVSTKGFSHTMKNGVLEVVFNKEK